MPPVANKPISEKFMWLGTAARRMLVTSCIKKLTDDDWLTMQSATRNHDANSLGLVLDEFLEHVFNTLPFATTSELPDAPNLKR